MTQEKDKSKNVKPKRRNRGWNDGAIYRERNGNYRAQVSLANGKRRSKTFRTKEECKNWIKEMQSAPTADETSPDQSKVITVRDWFAEWLGQSVNRLRPNTYHDYQRFSDLYILPALGDIQLTELTRRQVNAFYNDLTEKQKVSISSVRLTHRILHRAMEAALEVNLITANPAHSAAVPRKEETEMMVLNEPQIWSFLTTLHGHEHESLFDLAVKTGMREGELLGLKWSDIDFFHGTVTIQRQVRRIPKKGLELRPLKTKSSRRTIHLGERTLNLLRVHKVDQDAWKQEQGSTWQENDLVFPSIIGTPMDQSNLVAEFKSALELAGLPEVRFHDLRHTAASIMLKHLKDVLVVSRTLGHSRASTTLNIYAHLLPGMQAEAAQRIDEALSPTAINGAVQSEAGAAVKAEIEAGMGLNRLRRLKKQGKKAAQS